MSAKTTGRKKRIIITTAAMLAIGGGAAFAYWTSSATSNTAGAAADQSENFSIVSSVSGAPLSPGSTDPQTVTFTVTNTSDGGQMLSDVDITVANTTGGAWTAVAGCSVLDFTVGDVFVGSKPFTAVEIAKGESITGTATLGMKDRTGVNQNGCKGAVVPVHVAAS